MGEHNSCAMKSCVIALAFVAVVFSAPTVNEDVLGVDFETELVQDETVASLNNMVAELKKVAPAHLQGHVSHMAEHAELIQEGKAKAYAHDFNKSKRAIAAALKSLNDDLDNGHNHDKAALATAKHDNTNAVKNADSNNKESVKTVRGKACPTKRAEEAADAAKKAAKSEMDGIYNKKICGISTTWRDMDIEKDIPKMGTVLRNQWDKTRALYVAAKSKHDAAVKAHQNAVNKNNAAMAAFTTALDIQAGATLSTCKTAHAEYETLKKDVASNVVTRKQTYIAALVIKCYVDNMTDNAGAKKCADSKRSASTTKFDITPPVMAPCASKVKNVAAYGPAGWKPTKSNCGVHKGGCTSTVWEGDGNGKSEKFVGRAASLKACGALVAQKHPSANGATHRKRDNNCYAEFGMSKSTGRHTGDHTTCLIYHH